MPTHTDATLTQAEQEQAAFSAQVARIQADPMISSQGRRIGLAKAYTRHKSTMDALSASLTNATAAAGDALEKSLWGADLSKGADAISWRDAQDRAANLSTPAEAAALLQRAELTGDTHLSKAVAHEAYLNARHPLTGAGWGDLLDTYASRRPEVATEINQLIEAHRNNVYTAIDRAFTFAVNKPPELAGLHDTAISTLAETDPAGT